MRRISAALSLTVLAAVSACRSPDPEPATTSTSEQASDYETQRRAAVAELAELERGIEDTDVVVDWRYVGNLIRVRDVVAPPPSGRGWIAGPVVPALSDDERRALGGRLRDALAEKRGPALAAAVLEGLQLLGTPDPSFRGAAMRAWADGDPEFRRILLQLWWPVVRCDEFAPLLRAQCDAAGDATPWHVDDARTFAVVRLLELRPDEGRARILADIAAAHPRFGGRALVALPDAHLDEVDAHFRLPIEKLVHWSFDAEKFGPLAERYGGPDAVAAAKTVLDRPERVGDSQMIRVVLAHDRAEGLRRLDRALRAGRTPSGMRPAFVMENVLAGNWILRQDLWGADAAGFVRALLTDADPRIDDDARRTASRLLAEHG